MKYATEIDSGGMIYSYMPSFMKTGIGIQAILKLFLRNMRGCKVDITDGEIYEVGC
jgi:hypothetical protein